MTTTEEDFSDGPGRLVHQFSLRVKNLGMARLADLLLAMLEAGDWREFKDGLGTYRFLPGEFDYFLTQQGIDRDQVVHGITDTQVKAKLEAAMDERRTGEDDYRRSLAQVRFEVPSRPGRTIDPFGYTKAEFKVQRPALGNGVRRYVSSGGQVTRSKSELRPRWERIARSAVRLSDQDLVNVGQAIQEEIGRRGSAQ